MTSKTMQDELATAAMGERRRASAATDFGDVRAEFNALISGCGAYDLGWRTRVTLTGGDRVRWLNGMVTNNVRDLAVGSGLYAFLLNPQGHILADLYIYNRGESLVVDTDQSQLEKVLAIFDKYIIMDDVEVVKGGDKPTAIGIAGPQAEKMLRDSELEFPQLQPLQFVDLNWRQIGLTLVRGDRMGVDSFELWLAPADTASVLDALVRAGAKPVGTAALELLRIAAGIPRYGQDIRERDLPQETEQRRAVHFSKGCYIGQEIVERIRSRGNVHRKFTGFLIEGPLPAPGTKLQAEGKDIGEITSPASLPIGDGQLLVALGYIRREIATPGRQVEAGNAKARVANLPFAEVFKN